MKNNKLWQLLRDILEGLSKTCNHCQDQDCKNCWSNDIKNRIIEIFNPPANKTQEKEQKYKQLSLFDDENK